MKKLFTFFFFLLFMMCVLSACQKETAPLRICLDIPDRCGSEQTSAVFQRFLASVAEKGGPSDVEVEYIPQEGENRKNALTHLRTEIMAKSGPDLFILCTEYRNDTVFLYPEKAMENRLVLPLTKYMEDSSCTDWNALIPQIMDAGKYNDEQYLIPISFTFPVTCYSQSDFEHTPSSEYNWDNIVSSDNLFLRNSEALIGGAENKLASIGSDNFSGLLGTFADYEKEELLFSEEDLKKYIGEYLDLYDFSRNGGFGSLPEHFQANVSVPFWNNAYAAGGGSSKLTNEVLTIVPQYNRNGGVTATIFDYACINANTSRGEDAFFILDHLMERSFQQNSELFQYIFFTWDGAPVDAELMSAKYPISGQCMSENNFEQYQKTRDAITAVNFYSKINKSLDTLMFDCVDIVSGYAQGDIDELVKETYRAMRMDLAES